ncbi:hypothetical protein ASPSYDRAFT_406307 [Aspergillus sydowii CBS 593.65]|uniref:Uncharacterized protein n=1 Tax=Aspergillus sydowii CBS 593.65 TaxID=1036612 RepID=A0A1L9T9U6_9EURO|nr:uncharacterized protein ASPSYDRAFT_406307 [Aspergillus sydowii CBS 593.65]OJJ56194.1 hypothetical protein ASPSYDRAFT_406307 [Aspergillus sydowii CBS 593.65]
MPHSIQSPPRYLHICQRHPLPGTQLTASADPAIATFPEQPPKTRELPGLPFQAPSPDSPYEPDYSKRPLGPYHANPSTGSSDGRTTGPR